MLPIQPAQNITQDYSTYIINLSTIHGLAPLSTVLDNFAKLHFDYANSWLHFEWYSKLWVSLKYWTMTVTINEYKLGKINTEEFIEHLLGIFYFLKNNPQVENPQQLLKDTWNSLITWIPKSTTKLQTLVNKNQFIYFISNTNPLNIKKVIELFEENFPNDWKLPEETEAKPLEIANNFYLCTSYQYKEFKEGTPGLIVKLKEYLLNKGEKLKNILLVSQYIGDLDKANELGIESQSADQFFPKVLALRASQPVALNNAIMPPANFRASTLPSNLLNHSRLVTETQQQEEEESNSEKKPLLKH
jgi:hypothetical protein